MADAKPKILYVEDDEALSYVTRDNLEMYGFDVTWCADGLEAWKIFNRGTFDLCIFDVMLPGSDGFDLAAKVRQINSDIPIIFLTARTMREDRITGLKKGGDDYITKPFSIEELYLKINVFLQRARKTTTEEPNNMYSIGAYHLDFPNQILKYRDKEQALTSREAELLAFFARNRNKVLDRETILDAVWKNSDFFISRSLDVFVSRLRKYLKEDSTISLDNVHGIGFKLRC